MSSKLPTLAIADLYSLMAEAEEIFESDWDPFPAPKLSWNSSNLNSTWNWDREHGERVECIRIDLDATRDHDTGTMENYPMPPSEMRAQAMTLWFHGQQWRSNRTRMQATVAQLLSDNPHSTLQIVLDPQGDPTELPPELSEQLLAACYAQPNYLDRYYSLHPGGLRGSKRVLVLIDASQRAEMYSNNAQSEWLDQIGESATIVYRGGGLDIDELENFELVVD